MTSYLAFQESDLGRPIVLHKPLQKGEHAQAGLVKVFDDPGMRPRVTVARKLEPAYVTNAPQSSPRQAVSAPVTPAPTPSTAWPWSRRDDVRQVLQHTSNVRAKAARADSSVNRSLPTAPRDYMSVADIEGARPMTAARSAVRLSLDVSDIHGTKSSLQKSHINTRHLTLDVSDISGRKPDHTATHHKYGKAASAPTSTLVHPAPSTPSGQAPYPAVASPAPAPQAAWQEASCVADAMIWRPAAAPVSNTDDGGGNAAAAALQQVLQRQADRRAERDRELQAAKQAQRVTHNVASHHAVRVAFSEARAAEQRAAADVLHRQLQVGPEAVVEALRACETSDRECSGKVTPAELAWALNTAGVKPTAQQLGALVGGLQDDAGLLPYRVVVRALMHRGGMLSGRPAAARKPSEQQARASSAATRGQDACGGGTDPAAGGGSPFTQVNFWFGGALSQTGTGEEAAWRPGQDADAAGRRLLSGSAGPPNGATPIELSRPVDPACIRNQPTVCFLIKTGQLSRDEAQQQLQGKGAGASLSRAQSATASSRMQQRDFAASGAGSTLQGVMAPIGTGHLQVARTAQPLRPTSALLAAAGKQSSKRPFTAAGSGSNRQQYTQRATLQAEIAAVRTLS